MEKENPRVPPTSADRRGVLRGLAGSSPAKQAKKKKTKKKLILPPGY